MRKICNLKLVVDNNEKIDSYQYCCSEEYCCNSDD